MGFFKKALAAANPLTLGTALGGGSAGKALYNYGGGLKRATGLDSYKMAPVKFEGQQTDLMNMLMNQAKGGGPSYATEAMKLGVNQGLSNLRGSLQGMSGVSQGTRARLLSRQAGAGSRAIASEGGAMRSKEMMDARSNLANYILGSQEAQTNRSNVAYKAHEGRAQRRMSAVKALGEGLASFFARG